MIGNQVSRLITAYYEQKDWVTFYRMVYFIDCDNYLPGSQILEDEAKELQRSENDLKELEKLVKIVPKAYYHSIAI